MLLNCGVGEDSWESLGQQGDQTSQSWRESILNIHWKDWCWSSKLWPPDAKNWPNGKDPDPGQDWRQEEKGTSEDEMVGWPHWLDGHEFEQAPGAGDGQGGLSCCSPWGHKESETTEQLSDWTSWLTDWEARASPVAQRVKNLPAMQETQVWSLGWEDSPGGGNGNPLQYSRLKNPMDGGPWWATVHRSCSITQGGQPGALWWPRRVGLRGGEGGSRGWDIYTVMTDLHHLAETNATL